jgi:hypothetical protein
MQKLLIALASGLLFGVGLALAGMTNPAKVLGFLDITGQWDASLMLVLGGAVGVTALCFRRVLRNSTPVFDSRFHLPEKKQVDVKLVAGSVLFGIGWGISGYCPGPAITLLANPNHETLVFLPALFAGWILFACLDHKKTA